MSDGSRPDGFWPDGKAAIVLLPSGAQGETLLELAAQWTKTGLLGQALWVLPEHVKTSEYAPPQIEAVVLGVGADLESVAISVDLFEALAEEPLGLVRLVTLRSALPERQTDAAQDAVADLVSRWVRTSMPLPNPSATLVDQTTELRRVTLICAPTAFQLRERVEAHEHGFIVIASPEDRSSPWSGDAFVRDDERFTGFTLTHLASVAGLWNGITDGSVELMSRETDGGDSVWISRVFMNAVLTESLGRRVAAGVLENAARPDSLLIDPSVSPPPPGTAFIEDGQIAGYVDGMVEGALRLDGGALTYDSAGALDVPEPSRIGFFAQIGRFFAFSAGKLVQMPRWSARWLSSSANRSMTRALHTAEGSAVVGSSFDEVLDVRDRLLLADLERLRDDEGRARVEAGAPAAMAHVRTTPQLWAGLRELVFGALDGSADLRDAGFVPVEGAVPVFGRVGDVLALPDGPWESGTHDVPPGFPARVDWYALALSDPRRQLENWVTAAEASAAAEVPDVAEASFAPPAQETLVEEEAASTDSAEPARPVVQIEVPAEEPVAPVVSVAPSVDPETRRSGRMQALAEYDLWAGAQSSSFVWRFLDRIGSERRRAEDEVAYLVGEIDAIRPQRPGELLALRRDFHRSMLVGWITVLALALAVGVGIWFVNDYAARTDSFDPRILTSLLSWTLVGLGGAALLITLVSLVRYHAGWSRFERRIEVERTRLAHYGASARRAREEAARLRSVHRQAVDWLVLLSKAIHRPWHVPPVWTQHETFDVERGAMPFAVRLATVSGEETAAVARMRAAMTSKLVRRGWRHEAFEALVQEMAADYGAGQGFGLSALDEDLPHSSNHTRRMLLRALDDESLLTRIAAPRLADIVASVQRDEESIARPRVRPMGSNPLNALRRPEDYEGIELDVPWDDFLLESLTRADPMTPVSATVLTELQVGERYHERVTSFLVAPSRLQERLRFDPAAPIHVVPYEGATGAPVDLVWRVDVVGPVPRAAIRLWDGAVRADSEPTVAPRDVDTGI
ncbi:MULTISPECIES: hypothetical protein [unclassified Rathayibacter]|uniref:hypothetical protein n=1 Tax=unclassified Rathayibacter TaxID=2609250 RepID=UPI0006F84438|nr:MULTISPECIES: hypothetical protein [unclassified Rathayibacter]KQQ03624.1 hypothetical protein ASF42_09005 [Rathayibacter sp. Leaf294]KQS12080.1 hypothetical protein ASG06_09005 [Rathayibacter sp. Leaf185]